MGCGASSSAHTNLSSVAADELPLSEPPKRRASVVSMEIEPSDLPREQLFRDEMPLFPGIKQHRIGTYSSHGMKPGGNGAAFAKINQDRGLITYPFNDDPSMALFGVFDGHGANGEQVSDFVMWKVQELLLNNASQLRTSIESCLIYAFEEADRQLVTANVSAKVSGTAAVVCVMIGNTIWAANAGDSRAVLATRENDSPSSRVIVTPLTEDQKPDCPIEEARILKSGGYVSKASPHFGPPRVWVRQGEGPGLAMARSIGDHVCKHVGVIATPVVQRFEIDPNKESRLLLASDGVWELCARPAHPLHVHAINCATMWHATTCVPTWGFVGVLVAQYRERAGDGDCDGQSRCVRRMRCAH